MGSGRGETSTAAEAYSPIASSLSLIFRALWRQVHFSTISRAAAAPRRFASAWFS